VHRSDPDPQAWLLRRLAPRQRVHRRALIVGGYGLDLLGAWNGKPVLLHGDLETKSILTCTNAGSPLSTRSHAWATPPTMRATGQRAAAHQTARTGDASFWPNTSRWIRTGSGDRRRWSPSNSSDRGRLLKWWPWPPAGYCLLAIASSGCLGQRQVPGRPPSYAPSGEPSGGKGGAELVEGVRPMGGKASERPGGERIEQVDRQ
jgi:hypothetical protein